MERSELIERLQGAACRLARRYGYGEVNTRQDESKGIYDDGFVSQMERRAGGDCRTRIAWSPEGAADKSESVEFDYRFTSPRITVRRKAGVLACAEVNRADGENDASPWTVTETMVFRPLLGGNALLDDIMREVTAILGQK